MTLTLTIDCDNAAFEDCGEVARILRELAERVDGREAHDMDEIILRDVNGNRVGDVRVS